MTAALDALGARGARRTPRCPGPRGLWPYGQGPDLAWVDGFHTAYVLDGLHDVWRATGDDDVLVCLRGARARISRGSSLDGERRGSRDAAALSRRHTLRIERYRAVRTGSRRGRTLLGHGAEEWLNGRSPTCTTRRGFFYFQKTRWYTNRIPVRALEPGAHVPALAALAAAWRRRDAPPDTIGRKVPTHGL